MLGSPGPRPSFRPSRAQAASQQPQTLSQKSTFYDNNNNNNNNYYYYYYYCYNRKFLVPKNMIWTIQNDNENWVNK